MFQIMSLILWQNKRTCLLEPNLVDAWIELGECYWKRGDVETAKTCFEGALSHVSNIDELELFKAKLF